MASDVTLRFEDQCETFSLDEGRVHVPTVERTFALRLARINGAIKPVDSQGFTYETFNAGDILNVSGRPAEVFAVPDPTPSAAKLDEVLSLLKAQREHHFTFSEAATGKDVAVTAAMNALGLSGLALGALPKSWSTGWKRKSLVPFAKWPATGQILEEAYAAQLRAHFHAALGLFDVPLDVPKGFQMLDVHTHTKRLSFACTTETFKMIFNGGTDAVVVPYGAIPWQNQTRVIFDWKRPSDLQYVGSVITQAKLELMGALYNSNHPALVVFTDGINFVVLQPWGRGIHYWHTFSHEAGSVPADDVIRLIAHHLLNISSPDPLFSYLHSEPENEDLSMELAPLRAAKQELGQDEGLLVHLQLDKDLPFHERLDAMSASIHAWQKPIANLSHFS